MYDFNDDIFDAMEIAREHNLYHYPRYANTSESYSVKDNKNYWVTKTGKKLFAHEMEDTHLRNTVRLIERKCKEENDDPFNYKIYVLLLNEMLNRGIE